MELTNEQYEKLIRFLDGEMEAEEMSTFEKELENTPALRAQLDLEQDIRTAFYTNEHNSVDANKLTGTKNKKPVIIFPLRSMVAAAAILLLVTVGAFYLLNYKQASEVSLSETNEPQKKDTTTLLIANGNTVNYFFTDSTFEANYKKPPIPQSYPLILAEALQDFENNHYAAIEKFNVQQLPEVRGAENQNNEIRFLANFYTGIALLQQNQATAAIEKFNKALIYKNEWNDKAHWYLSLAYLKNKEINKSINQLQFLTHNSVYSKKAVALLDYLNLKL